MARPTTHTLITFLLRFNSKKQEPNEWDGSTHYKRLILCGMMGDILQEKKYCVVPLFTTVNDKVRNKNNSASAIDC